MREEARDAQEEGGVVTAPRGWDDVLRIPDSDFHGMNDAVEVTKRLEYSWFLYRGDIYFLDDGHAQRLTEENAVLFAAARGLIGDETARILQKYFPQYIQ